MNTEKRRDFLKKSGMGAIAGAGALAGLTAMAREQLSASTETEVPQGKVRWGMVIDMRKCPDECTDCIDACHRVHNVPDFDNPKDEIKWVWKSPRKKVFPSKSLQFAPRERQEKPFLTLCNQCADPPCTRVCPTGATFSRPDGIVQMDFHRCIGCRFCMAGCPYGSRSFNWRDPRPAISSIDPSYPTRERGVVEKCNFCVERIEKQQLPHCVEICPEKALTFGNLNDPESSIRKLLASEATIQRKPELGTRPSVFYIT